MTNARLIHTLQILGACAAAIDWVGKRDLAAAWADCERADWMLWLAGNMAGKPGWRQRKEVILAAIACGRLSLKHAGKYKKQLSEVFDVAERCANNPTVANQIAAWSAAGIAAGIAPLAWRSANVAFWIAESAASTAESAWRSAEIAVRIAGWSAAHKRMCKLIRRQLTIPELDRTNAA